MYCTDDTDNGIGLPIQLPPSYIVSLPTCYCTKSKACSLVIA